MPQGTARSGGAGRYTGYHCGTFRSIMPLTCTLTVGDCWPVMVAMNPPRTFHRTPVAPEPRESSPGSPAALG